MRYVILKKIDNIWFATRNRYTAKELEILVDKLYGDIVDFELINDDSRQGLDDGVIIVKDDGRELNENGIYLNDDLEIEKQPKHNDIKSWMIIVAVLVASYDIRVALSLVTLWGFVVLFVNIVTSDSAKIAKAETQQMQDKLDNDHKAKGMM